MLLYLIVLDAHGAIYNHDYSLLLQPRPTYQDSLLILVSTNMMCVVQKTDFLLDKQVNFHVLKPRIPQNRIVDKLIFSLDYNEFLVFAKFTPTLRRTPFRSLLQFQLHQHFAYVLNTEKPLEKKSCFFSQARAIICKSLVCIRKTRTHFGFTCIQMRRDVSFRQEQ